MITPDGPGGGDDSAWAPRDPAAPAAAGTARSDELLAGYHGFHVVARGGDSVVYRARQDDLDRDVAVKVVLLDDPDTRARFERELAITVRLGRQHPHIVTVLATGTTRDGQPCLVMDFFELGSLHDRLAERGPLPVSEVVGAGSVVADALGFAHAQGVLHRDVKPQNILVLPTSYVLADFGLARAIDAGHSASLERFSYRHASPQVLDGEAPTTADDIYSLGSTLFTLLDGRPPFAAADPDEDSALSYLRRARTGEPRELSRPDVPPELIAIVQRCLAKSAADRFPDAGALRAALEAVPTESRSWAPGAAPVAAAAREPIHAPSPASPPAPLPSPAAPPPPADAPVAVSALAHLDVPAPAAPPGLDDATGLRPDESSREPEAPPAPARRWLLLAALAAVALVAGLVIGLRTSGSGSSAGHSSPPTTHSSPHTSAPPTSASSSFPTGRPMSSSASRGATVADPSIAPEVTGVRRAGRKVTLTIVDRSKGVAQLLVVQPGRAAVEVPKGASGVTLVDQPAGQVCYAVEAIAGGANDSILVGTTKVCTPN